MPDANQPQWIAMSERKPLAEDLPVWVYDVKKPIRDYPPLWHNLALQDFGPFSHWRPARGDIPAPPPLPLSREDQDFEEYHEWWKANTNRPQCDSWPAVAHMLAWDRAEVEKLIGALESLNRCTSQFDDVLKQLRARCASRK